MQQQQQPKQKAKKPRADRLTPKQENFCHAYLETGSASSAYRAAYNTQRMKDETVWVNASQLLNKAKVALRIAELKAPALESTQLTVESHLAQLTELRDQAIAVGKMAAAVRAEELRGKVAGFYTEKAQIELTGGIKLVRLDD